MGESSKRWWETLGGLMTGVAALVTAITGLIVALYTLDRPESRSHSPVTTVPTAGSKPSAADKATDEANGTSGAPHTSIAEQPAHPISLPENSTYVLGPAGQTARYELQSAVISAVGTEGDILRIHVRYTNLSDNPNSVMHFESSLFRLVINERRLWAKQKFHYTVRSHKVREEDVLFLISKGVKQVTLKIGNNADGVDVPLDLDRGA